LKIQWFHNEVYGGGISYKFRPTRKKSLNHWIPTDITTSTHTHTHTHTYIYILLKSNIICATEDKLPIKIMTIHNKKMK